MENLLEIRNLKVYYSTESGPLKALNGIQLHVPKGKIVGVIGESGAGKTTLLLAILRLLPTNARIVDGEIIFRGRDILKMDEETLRHTRQKYISLIIQSTSDALNPTMFSGLQAAEALEIHEELEPDEALEVIKHMFEELGLEKTRVFSLPDELSVGMRQRIKLAIAISTLPDLILADEPFTGLDPPIQLQVEKYIIDLYNKYRFSMLVASHNLGRLAEISQFIAVLYGGKIVEYNSTKGIFGKPVHPYTKGLIGAVPNPKAPKRRLIYIPGNPPDLTNPPKGCIFWPRCPHAKEICKEKEPELRNLNGGMVACHFAEELKDLSPWDFWTKDIAYY